MTADMLPYGYKGNKSMNISKLIPVLAAGLLLAVAAPRVLAADGTNQEVTITGKMVCGKCTLHLTKECQNVVQVQKDGKTINYFLVQNDVSKAAHQPVCDGSSENVTVTGAVTEKDGQETMTPTKLVVDKS
jgi:Family of unknown function (DUF6370)